MVEANSPKSHKDQGNEFYKAEQWLKAAACYTKGIKEEPENTVLYRYNRSLCKGSFGLLPGETYRDEQTCLQQPLCSSTEAAKSRQSFVRCRDLHTY